MEKRIPIEISDLIDPLIADTLKAHPDIETPLDKYCNILNIFSWMHPKEIADLMQIDEDQSQAITMGDVPKDSDLEARLNQTCAYALMLYDRYHGDPDAIEAAVERPIPMLRKNSVSPARSPMQCIKQGDIHIVLYAIAVERQFHD